MSGLVIIFAVTCYVVGYVWATSDIKPPNVKGRVYYMQETTVIQKEEMSYILYPLYGEILIYQSDGSFYDTTGIWLCELSKEDQIEILNRKRVFSKEDLFNYLESLKP